VKNRNSLLLLPVIFALPLAGPSCNIPQNDGGIYKTIDGGVNWKQIVSIEESKNTLAKTDTDQLLVDPNNPDVVFMVTKNQGLYVSNQFGESWKRIIPETNTVYSIEADPAKRGLFYASILLNGRAKILKTEDGGQDWKEIYTEAGKNNYITQVKVDPFFEDSLAAANSEGLLVRSGDGGSTWQATFPFNDPVMDLIFDPVKENFIWALTGKGVWHSSNGGTDFNLLELPENGEMGNSFYLLRKFGPSLFLATEKGFYQSVDDGKMWRKIITLNNPVDFPARDFVIFPDNNGNSAYVPSLASNGAEAGKWALGAGMTLYVTGDAGRSWKPIQFEIDRMVNAIAVKNNDSNQILVGVEAAASRTGLGLGY